MTTESPVTELKGVGDQVGSKLASLGIKTIADLINYFPRRYDDFSSLTPIRLLSPGNVSLKAKIGEVKGRYARRGIHVTEAVARDEENGTVRLVWFNQPYRAGSIKAGQDYFISGTYERRRGRFSILNPAIEMAVDLPVNTARILAVYKESKGITSRQIRTLIHEAAGVIESLPETLPEETILKNRLVSRSDALLSLHAPESIRQLDDARYRLGFEEIFRLSLASLMNKRENKTEKSLTVRYDEKLAVSFSRSLPFKLTDAQRLVVMRIYKNLQKQEPMNRLIEGDVGSGKTVVAAMAALMAMSQGYQVALMAPTELLARQHADTIHELLRPLGLESGVELLIGSMKADQKKRALNAISSGKANFIIGTHALIQERVDMKKLALVIIDEQHRFGVEQRKALLSKAGHMPHVLSLTATPIPRSLALTLYGELDVSRLNEKPAGRESIETEIVAPSSRPRLTERLSGMIEKGSQMFVVCPVISESSSLEAKSAEKVFEQLSAQDFKQFRVGLLHGQMKVEEKKKVMEQFVSHKLDILVSTTVIEVGVDVPNADIMMIESAERFGLAQLHQLRGRVGRRDTKGYCFLMLDDSSPPSARLRAMQSTDDGFRLAELDLRLRGPGAIYGTMQHGALDLRIANLSDTKLITAARTAAQAFLDRGENLLKYKELKKQVDRLRAVTNLN